MEFVMIMQRETIPLWQILNPCLQRKQRHQHDDHADWWRRPISSSINL